MGRSEKWGNEGTLKSLLAALPMGGGGWVRGRAPEGAEGRGAPFEGGETGCHWGGRGFMKEEGQR